MTPLIVIPARMASARLPGKPLADIHGLPMIVHVMNRAADARAGRVIVAAADAEIADAVRAAGGEAVLTRADHASGSDRAWEAAQIIDPGGEHPVIVNLQGDLPTLAPDYIGKVLAPLADDAVDISTLATEITDDAERDNPNVVKVVFSPDGTGGSEARRGRAYYFTRATAPSGDGPLFHHIGIYAYQRPALARFVSLPPSPLERRERLEQLRALEAGMRIDVVIVDGSPLGVDTPADLEAARAQLAPASDSA